MTLGFDKRRARFVLPGIYIVLAAYAWIDFTRTNPDGLANVGLFLVTFPVTLIGFLADALLGTNNVLLPEGHGYFGDHALYYVPAVAVCALLLWWIGRAIDRWGRP